MGKVEIKIRKKILTPDNLLQYRNYPALLKKYERTKRFRRALRIFLYSLALTVFVLALVFLGMWKVLMDKKMESTQTGDAIIYLRRINENIDTLKVKIISIDQSDSVYKFQYSVGEYKGYLALPRQIEYNGISRYFFEKVKGIYVDNKNYVAIRYKFQNLDHTDHNDYYYYSPEFGVLIFSSSFNNHQDELIKTQTINSDEIVSEMIQEIKSDTVFYKQLKP